MPKGQVLGLLLQNDKDGTGLASWNPSQPGMTESTLGDWGVDVYVSGKASCCGVDRGSVAA